MKALVLSGGQGTRLRPLTYTMAKQLIPIANKPILHYVIENIISYGIKDIGVIISPETGEQIRKSLLDIGFESAHGVKFSFIPQDQPRGLAHAVMIAKDFLGGDRFIMYLGDNLIGDSLNDHVGRFETTQTDVMFFLKEVADPRSFGVAVIRDGKIVRLVEKPKELVSNLAITGVYLFSGAIFKVLPELKPSWRNEYEIVDAISLMISKGYKSEYAVLSNWWLDTGKKDDLLDANRVILDERLKQENKGRIVSSKVAGRVAIGEGTVIDNSVVRGPAAIGRNCVIKNSQIGAFTAVADGALIENSSVEFSVVMEGARISDVLHLEESIIGRKAVVRQNDSAKKSVKLLIGDDNEVVL